MSKGSNLSMAVKEDRVNEVKYRRLAGQIAKDIENEKYGFKFNVDSLLKQLEAKLKSECECREVIEDFGEKVKYCYCL